MSDALRPGEDGHVISYRQVWAIYWIALLAFLLIFSRTVLGEMDEEFALRADGFVLLIFAIAGVAYFCTAVLYPMHPWGRGVERPTIIKAPWKLLIIAANSLYCFWIIEYVNNDKLIEMEPFYVGINVLGIFLMHLIILCWTNSLRACLFTGLSIWSFFAMVFHVVYEFRGEPLQIIDFTSVRTAFAVTGGYTIRMIRPFIVDIVLWGCLFAVYIHVKDAHVFEKKRRKILLRVFTLAAMIVSFFLYLGTGWNASLSIKTDLFAPIKTYKQYGTSVGFFCVGKYMRLVPPEKYTPGITEEIAREHSDAYDDDHSVSDVVPVNIIAIMNEAWADYSYAGDLRTNIDPMPYYHAMRENTIKGYNLVCITGGGTAKTEYEFLTGNSVKRFPGMVPYVSYFTHDQYSLVSTLKSQGYEAVAMHPYKGSNWKRPSAYKLLDFSHFYTEEDFDENAERIRGHISDRANYEGIIRLIEEKENSGDPLFIFDITMQNHGGYTNKTFTGKVTLDSYDEAEEGEKETVERYLSLSKVTDDALMYLIEYFRGIDEPTLILMFGDHYPTLPDSVMENFSGKPFEELSFEEQQRYYATPFFIWANYDIPEREGVVTSTNYLGTMMLDCTGLSQPEYNKYLDELMRVMPALNHQGYVTSDGNHVKWDEAEEPYSTLEWEYECLQYNELAENRERLDWFFTLGDEDL